MPLLETPSQSTHTLSSIHFHVIQQRFDWADSTARKNNFNYFWMIAASRTNVHQQHSLFRSSFVLNQNEEACLYVYVSPEVPWSFLARRLLSSTSWRPWVTKTTPLRNHNQWISHFWTTQAAHTKGPRGLSGRNFRDSLISSGTRMLFSWISWTGVTLVPWQIVLFPSGNHDVADPKKSCQNKNRHQRWTKLTPTTLLLLLYVHKLKHNEDRWHSISISDSFFESNWI